MTHEEAIKVVSSPELIAEIEAVSSYWTGDKMSGAIPISREKEEAVAEALAAGSPSIDIWVQDGPMIVKESVPADDGELEKVLSSFQSGESLTDFVTTKVTNRAAFPFKVVGKMFMSFNGQDYVGSAWTIGESGIFTAGHCVYDENAGWASNVLFIPQYHEGNAPLGTWVASQLFSLKGWTDGTSNRFRYDMGAFLTTQPVRPKTGSLGWLANVPPNQGPYTAIGYPASPVSGYNFDGERMWKSVGGYINGTDIIQMYNNMTGGCSGGPWTVSKNGSVYANGLNSFRYTNNPSTMYSPYFGQGFLNLHDKVK